MIKSVYDPYDVIVIGAGHAGCEAALIAARMNIFTVGQMSSHRRVTGHLSNNEHFYCWTDVL